MPTPAPLPPSAAVLAEILTKGGPRADAIRERFHRTMLWKFTTGHRKPGRESAVELAQLSGGKVRVDGWEDTATAKAG